MPSNRLRNQVYSTQPFAIFFSDIVAIQVFLLCFVLFLFCKVIVLFLSLLSPFNVTVVYLYVGSTFTDLSFCTTLSL